ncbi:acyl-CoA thioester hydrolase/BAAT C-terminal domain-containing protein [Winogradskyella aurantiaca]|uniref:acyl-CoA thioester hydrolase/BAAT C-terminal domain-containing protein n=1 Tax=Winogradskyella aurantiaca TaxID=2219558 RepID=UPI000E1C8290|nr:acyl-CoA thioester hydrolase/BAAT C-terminal domain-containing protein [Winogradskyella aurantiaca]
MSKKRKYIIPFVIIIILTAGYLIADSILFDGVKPKVINVNGFQAKYFAKDNLANKTAVILIGGGQWGDYWANEFANKEMVALSLPYNGIEGLPKLPEDIDLEYFENAIQWLKSKKEVSSEKIVVMGASRNAELALVIASTFTNSIKGVIAYSPSSVSWSNTVLPYNSSELKPSWKYKGIDIPYIPMEKLSGNVSGKVEMIDYWEKGLSKTDLVENASIKVENISGPILLFSGSDDRVWPSAKMADMIEKRLEENSFTYTFNNIQFENAGHLISRNPEQKTDIRTGKINLGGREFEYEFGGTDSGDYKAKKDAKMKLMEFLKAM